MDGRNGRTDRQTDGMQHLMRPLRESRTVSLTHANSLNLSTVSEWHNAKFTRSIPWQWPAQTTVHVCTYRIKLRNTATGNIPYKDYRLIKSQPHTWHVQISPKLPKLRRKTGNQKTVWIYAQNKLMSLDRTVLYVTCALPKVTSLWDKRQNAKLPINEN